MDKKEGPDSDTRDCCIRIVFSQHSPLRQVLRDHNPGQCEETREEGLETKSMYPHLSLSLSRSEPIRGQPPIPRPPKHRNWAPLPSQPAYLVGAILAHRSGGGNNGAASRLRRGSQLIACLRAVRGLAELTGRGASPGRSVPWSKEAHGEMLMETIATGLGTP